MGYMKWTSRTRRVNIERILRWYCKEKKISDLDISLGMPELFNILEDEGEMDFDDIVAAFDWIGIDLVAVPRGSTKAMEWYCINAMPFDDGGKFRRRDALAEKRHRRGKELGRGRKRIQETDREAD